MTGKDLRNVRFLNGRISLQRKAIREIDSKILSLRESLQPGTANYSAMPKPPNASDKISDILAEIDKLEREKRLREISVADCKSVQDKIRRELNFALAEFGDVQIEDAIKLHYNDGKSWTATAIALGFPNTADNVRKRVGRFLHKTESLEFKKKFANS